MCLTFLRKKQLAFTDVFPLIIDGARSFLFPYCALHFDPIIPLEVAFLNTPGSWLRPASSWGLASLAPWSLESIVISSWTSDPCCHLKGPHTVQTPGSLHTHSLPLLFFLDSPFHSNYPRIRWELGSWRLLGDLLVLLTCPVPPSTTHLPHYLLSKMAVWLEPHSGRSLLWGPIHTHCRVNIFLSNLHSHSFWHYTVLLTTLRRPASAPLRLSHIPSSSCRHPAGLPRPTLDDRPLPHPVVLFPWCSGDWHGFTSFMSLQILE